MKYLFLDDERNPSDIFWNGILYNQLNWDIVRNYKEFKDYVIENGIPDILSFDNDLAEEKEGYDCAKWLCETYCVDNKTNIKEFLVHSKNNVMNAKITIYLTWFKTNFNKFF